MHKVYFPCNKLMIQTDVLYSSLGVFRVTKKLGLFFLLYTVDDGTGVINCLCWKNDLFKERVGSNQSKFATFVK